MPRNGSFSKLLKTVQLNGLDNQKVIEMTTTWTSKSGKSVDANVAGGDLLSQLCHGLFEKVGCYPKTQADCRLVARVLRNRLCLNAYWHSEWQTVWHIERINPADYPFLEKMIAFFEQADGIDHSAYDPHWVDDEPRIIGYDLNDDNIFLNLRVRCKCGQEIVKVSFDSECDSGDFLECPACHKKYIITTKHTVEELEKDE